MHFKISQPGRDNSLHQPYLKRPRTPFYIPPFNAVSISIKPHSYGPRIRQQPRFKLLQRVTVSNWQLRKQLFFSPCTTLPLSSVSSYLEIQKKQTLCLNNSQHRRLFMSSTTSSFISPLLPIKASAALICLHITKPSNKKQFHATKTTVHSAIDHPSSTINMMAVAFNLNNSDVTLTGTIVTIVFGWLALWQILTSQKIVPSIATRKVFHVTCGPAFVALWPLYSNSPMARVTAASVPLLFVTILVISGLSANENALGPRGMLSRMLSRGENFRDALQGPLYYTMVLLGLTLLLFKSVIAAIAVTQLCFGDAMAEIIGRRFGATLHWNLPGTGNKTVAGSLAFVIAALTGSVCAIQWYHYCDCSSLQLNDTRVLVQLAIISVACSAAELGSAMVSLDDNLTISTVAVILCVFMFGVQV